MNRFLLFLTLSAVLFSCAPDPLCNDPMAINYEDVDDFCEYQSSINFYVSVNSLELMQENVPSGSLYYDVWVRLFLGQNPNSYSQSYGLAFLTPDENLDNSNYFDPTDCTSLSYNSFKVDFLADNPNGILFDCQMILEYSNENQIVLWEGEVHFDPSDTCKIIEIPYE